MKLPKLANANLKGKRVLLRLDLNVPLQGTRVLDDYRIRRSFPTIRLLRERGAKTIIVSHAGEDGRTSLRPAARVLGKLVPAGFYPGTGGRELLRIAGSLKEGGVMVLENLRKDPGETKNDRKFARTLAALGDTYVNDAFSVSHRAHASIVSLPTFLPSYAGLLLEEEVERLSRAFRPPHPFLFVLGGAKFSTKIPLIKKFLTLADTVFVGGALANNFFKESGGEIGISRVDPGNFHLKPLLKSRKLLLPVDAVVEIRGGSSVKRITAVPANGSIKDSGPETKKLLAAAVSRAKFILWNGPLGNYEEGYERGTVDLLKMIAKSGAESIVGGGDTLALVAKLGLEKKFSFVSTGGGAMLDFLANGTLPGIEALRHSRSNKPKRSGTR